VKRTLAAALAAALALSLAACSEGDAEPNFAPSESGSPSTPETSPTEPRTKAPWEKNTRAGAVAFVKHWVAVFSEAQQTGDVSEMRAISASNCVSCTNLARHVEAVYSVGGFYESQGWRVQRTTIGRQIGLPTNVTKMLVKILRTPERWKEDATSAVSRNPASTADYEVRAEWVDGAWALERLVQLT